MSQKIWKAITPMDGLFQPSCPRLLGWKARLCSNAWRAISRSIDVSAKEASNLSGNLLGHLPTVALEHKVISELVWRSLEHHCNFYVVIHHATTCLFTFTNELQPHEKSFTEIHSRSRLIIHHSFQQANFSRCGVRLAFLVKQSPHLEPVLFLRRMSDTTQSFATNHGTHSSSDTSGHELFSCRQRCPQDRLTHVCRLCQKSLSVSRKPRQPIRELECKIVETTRLATPLLRSAKTSV